MTVGPVTIGGKIFNMTLGGRNAIMTSSRAHTAQVPNRAP